MNHFDIIREAIFTERSTSVVETDNVYTFRVHPDANKLEIKKAIEKAFKVKVDSIRTINVRSKRKMDRYRGIMGKTRSYKKAMIKLAEGHTIEFA